MASLEAARSSGSRFHPSDSHRKNGSEIYMKHFRISVVSIALLSSAAAQAADRYRGPVIDVHAHLRLGEKDAATQAQPIGTDALRKLDDAAGVTQSALIVMARKGQL